MKLHFFGTGASEGVPAVFCECEYCKKIRTLGGKNIRLRTSVQLDDHILIDFSSDGYAQSLFRGMDTTKITHVLITHSHEDHFYPAACGSAIWIKPHKKAPYLRQFHCDRQIKSVRQRHPLA